MTLSWFSIIFRNSNSYWINKLNKTLWCMQTTALTSSLFMLLFEHGTSFRCNDFYYYCVVGRQKETVSVYSEEWQEMNFIHQLLELPEAIAVFLVLQDQRQIDTDLVMTPLICPVICFWFPVSSC